MGGGESLDSAGSFSLEEAEQEAELEHGLEFSDFAFYVKL